MFTHCTKGINSIRNAASTFFVRVSGDSMKDDRIDDGDLLVVDKPEEMLDNFNEDIQSYGIGSIAELFDADPPFSPRGAISQAWSVAAVLDIWHLAHEHKAAEKPARAPRKSAAGKSAEKKAATATEKKSTEKKSSATAAEKKPAARRTVKKTEKK